MEKKTVIKLLQDRGHRLTKARLVVLQKALSRNGHFDTESLYLQIKRRGLMASRASVYRTLNLLCECGLIEQVRNTEHGAVYERTFGHKHHDHMLCTQCGNIIEFYSGELERIQENLCRKNGFQGTSHTLEIRGYCKQCRKKNN